MHIFFGLVFVIVWVGAAAFWGFVTLLPNAMMSPSNISIETLIFGFLGGVLVQAIAGIFVGMAIASKDKSRKYLMIFGVLFFMACAIQFGILFFS
jgi:hypothetical protein